MESFLSHVGQLLDFRQTLLTRRAERYASTIYAKEAALDKCGDLPIVQGYKCAVRVGQTRCSGLYTRGINDFIA